MKTIEFIRAAHEVVEKMKGTRSESTLANYSTAIRSLAIFLNDHPQQTQLDEQLLSAYQFWLQQKGVASIPRLVTFARCDPSIIYWLATPSSSTTPSQVGREQESGRCR